MTRKHLIGLLSVVALAACGGADPTAPGAQQPVGASGSAPLDVVYVHTTAEIWEDGKMRTATCYCCFVGGTPICYGGSCQ